MSIEFHDLDNKLTNMDKLPICKGTYSNESDISDVDFLNSVIQFFADYRVTRVPFFGNLCYCCSQLRSTEGPIGQCKGLLLPLQRCGGCQLVAYCSKKCQKGAWAVHKDVCKAFPVVNGKNVLQTTGSWMKHIADIRERIAFINDPVGVADRLFRNPRVCHSCREARPENLFDCHKCGCVSYCSKKCVKADKVHKEHCKNLLDMSCLQAFSVRKMEYLPSVKTESVCEKFTPITSSWKDIVSSNMFTDVDGRECINDIGIERLQYPMSLLYALQMLPERRLSPKQCPLEDLSSLEVHVINNSPLFDSEPWEIFMHRLPNLNQLKVVYILQGKPFKQCFNLNYMSGISLQRCEDCEIKNRVITYSVHQMHYHMYFSSEEYAEPNIVVIFGNTYEMLDSEEADINSDISYRNMTHSQDTVLVLMDTSKEVLRQGIRAVNAARPVDLLVLPMENPLRGFGSDRADIDSNTAVINDKHYFTCLRSK